MLEHMKICSFGARKTCVSYTVAAPVSFSKSPVGHPPASGHVTTRGHLPPAPLGHPPASGHVTTRGHLSPAARVHSTQVKAPADTPKVSEPTDQSQSIQEEISPIPSNPPPAVRSAVPEAPRSNRRSSVCHPASASTTAVAGDDDDDVAGVCSSSDDDEADDSEVVSPDVHVLKHKNRSHKVLDVELLIVCYNPVCPAHSVL